MASSNYLNASNAQYIEELLQLYRNSPHTLDPSWRYFFDGLHLVESRPAQSQPVPQLTPPEDLELEVKALDLIQAYREKGHLIADINPLTRGTPRTHPLLQLEKFGLSEKHLDRVFQVGQLIGIGAAPLRRIIQALVSYYCSPATVEYGHIDDPKSREWIQKRVESGILSKPLSIDQKLRTLHKLCEAEALDSFLHKRFLGQKRFSGEGLDVVIPLLDFLIEQASLLGADEIIVGMAHRGRLSVLANIFQKDLKFIFAEFSGNLDANVGDGDVKYHMGFSQNIQTPQGKTIHLSLMPNPSHLEAVNPVLMGVTRAKQRIKKDHERTRTLAVLLHGDASFSGQGSVYELLNMSELGGYTVGGTLHIITNNQIGFTTTPGDDRSTPQATDIAKMLEIPIFRVNADEPDHVMRCASLALQFRYKFKRDVVIDVLGYRRFGHNEGDEPSFTQPLMYQKINTHPRVLSLYSQKLQQDDVISSDLVPKTIESLHQKMDIALEEAKKTRISPMMHSFGDRWKNLKKVTDENVFQKISTEVSADLLKKILVQLLMLPSDFTPHPKIKKLFEERQEMLEGKRPIDWSLGEALCFGSLMCDGHAVRLAGQDVERGTFSHRHAVLHDVVTGKKYTPLRHIQEAKNDFEIFNSLLSEYGALGFEFGQSLASPKKLTIWEAQFGDFVNGAQIIIDQFISSSASKWQRYSGLVMLLPHGYEGQGPEHSSARLERFLQACAQNNIQVCNPTTPAQYFHLLRRQIFRDFRIPLIIMSPKSLLRHPLVVSTWEDLEKGQFQEIIDDPAPGIKEKAKRLILCSGKIYYELLDGRSKAKNKDVAIVRAEQLYPFPEKDWAKLLKSYPQATEVIWCQEGPQNMEGWNFMHRWIPALLQKNQTFTYVGRSPQASPADSFLHVHSKEQKRIVQTALGDLES